MKRLDDCFALADFREAARQRLPDALFHYIEGGADDEITLKDNTAAFDRYRFVPRYLQDIRHIDLRTSVFGCAVDWPVLVSPTGLARAFHPAGELGVAQEAAAAGIIYSLSGMGTASLEDVASTVNGPKMFQLYIFNDDKLNFELIDRCKAAHYDVLCLTVDCIAAGNRERDLRYGLTVPPRLGRRNLLGFMRHPCWCARYLTSGGLSLPNIPSGEGDHSIGTLAGFFARKMEQNITWSAIERLMRRWDGPLVIKGLQSVEDARAAAEAGVTGIILSNHGGRQLDSSAATINHLADVVDAVGDRLEVVLDGGIRRGSHVVKALSMGARACTLGRPYLYGLAAFGQPGVHRVLALLRQEITRTMILLGCSSLSDLGRHHLEAADRLPAFMNPHTPADAMSPPQLRSAL